MCPRAGLAFKSLSTQAVAYVGKVILLGMCFGLARRFSRAVCDNMNDAFVQSYNITYLFSYVRPVTDGLRGGVINTLCAYTRPNIQTRPVAISF